MVTDSVAVSLSDLLSGCGSWVRVCTRPSSGRGSDGGIVAGLLLKSYHSQAADGAVEHHRVQESKLKASST